MTQRFLSEESEGFGKKCFMCGSQYRLELDHFNEGNSNDALSNKWYLCKVHHLEKSKWDWGELVTLLANACIADPKLKRTLRVRAERRMLEYEDASRFPFTPSIESDPQKDKDVYKSREIGEIILSMTKQHADIKYPHEIIKLLGWFRI